MRREGTLGGILASNASGPRRHLYGTARDLLIGLTMVLADGSMVRGGGKVVKNVAGYDLPKLAIGSFGTLGVIVEATVKLRPRPDTDRLVVAWFERVKDAGAGARAIMASDLIPSALDLVDAEAMRAPGAGRARGRRAPRGPRRHARAGGLAVRRAGPAPRRRRPRGRRACSTATTATASGRPPAICRARAFPETTAVMRWGVLPTQVAELIDHGGDVARRHGLGAAFTAHAGVGIVTAILGGGSGGAAANTVAAALGDWRALVRDAAGTPRSSGRRSRSRSACRCGIRPAPRIASCSGSRPSWTRAGS